ncbi:hypothetical protein [uncultured Mediterranean phage uvMED]|nr:hypothetical protein [uncultured Mediterranean phage uvMED]
MHRIGLWMSFKKAQPNDLTFPYYAYSPTLGHEVEYDEKELWCEIDRILEEDPEHKFTIGQQCYFNLIHCSNSAYFLTDEVIFALEEYMAMKRFKIPLAQDIDTAPYDRLVIFSAIDDEYNAASKLDV